MTAQCLLTNRSSSTSTVEVEGRRVGPVTSGGLTDTDPVRTRSKVVQRIHLIKLCTVSISHLLESTQLILSYIVTTNATVNGSGRISDLGNNANGKMGQFEQTGM